MDRHTIISVLAGDATPEQTRALEEWRRESAENDAEFLRQSRLWALLGKLPLENVSDMDAASSTASLPRSGSAGPATKPQLDRKRDQVVLLLAAVFAGVVIGATAFRSGAPGIEPDEIRTGVDEVVTIELADGTTVRLGAESRLSFGDDRSTAAVHLVGQAFFAVPTRRSEPFRILTEGGDLLVYGTRFGLSADNRDIQVVVLEGRVEINTPGASLSVGRNEMGRSVNSQLVVEPVENVYQEVDWIGDFIVFQSTPLHDVRREFSTRFGIELDLGDADLSSRTVTGSFQDQSPFEMLAGICLAVDAICIRRGDTVEVRLRPLEAAEDNTI